jgi:hypothetical protein
LDIKLSLVDLLLAFESSFHIPLSHITNAYVGSLEDLELQYDLMGHIGFIRTVGLFASPAGLIFADVGEGDCLVVETRGERFPRIAVQLSGGADPNALAHEIVRAIPDSGPVE